MIKRLLPAAFFVGLMTASSHALAEDEFEQCLVRLQGEARQAGVPEQIVREVVPTLEERQRVVKLDRSQPEFVQTFGQYLSMRVNGSRINTGRKLFQKHRDFLDILTRQYGIPGQYLVSFWGLETNFGGYLGNIPTLDSLATLACDPRRSAFFTTEFVTALQLMHREGLQPDDMKGSWAGAVGHTQFMPSSYMRYAVDGDGDGAIDLWRSERDALASGANFLSQLGWKAGQRWGREVVLPDDFDFFATGRANRADLRTWGGRGVKTVFNRDLPAADMSGAVLVPAGASGPAFLVYDNFNVIMRWNKSESYALSVGLLADRIKGSPGLKNKPAAGPGVRYEDIGKAQQKLLELGYDPGPVDGIWGSATRQALSQWQRDQNRVADGFPAPAVIGALLAQSSD